MIEDEQQIDRASEGGFLLEHERELLKHQAETLRTFYSLTGAPRKDYTIQMAEAEAERIKIVRRAEAEGIMMIRQAEAEGLKLLGEALATTNQPDALLKVLALEAAAKIAQSLADGKDGKDGKAERRKGYEGFSSPESRRYLLRARDPKGIPKRPTAPPAEKA